MGEYDKQLQSIEKKLDNLCDTMVKVKEETDINTEFRERVEPKLDRLPKEFPCNYNDWRNPIVFINIFKVIAIVGGGISVIGGLIFFIIRHG